jgi:2-polyprenyl-3-methyl-5-hydroxy-6-metoxy-1,4-benzoquinol methylase
MVDDGVRVYRNTRQREQDDLTAGGHIGPDCPGLEIFHALRLGTLLTLIGDLSNPPSPLFVLDAGCGEGRLARALSRCGHRVDAIDTSSEAIAHARTKGGGPRYAEASLTDWRSPWLYDVVLCMDVRFHVGDDAQWAASLRNLASLVRVTGRLIVSDEDGHERTALGDSIMHRTTAAYCGAFQPLGLHHTLSKPYGFRGNPVCFHVFTRIR